MSVTLNVDTRQFVKTHYDFLKSKLLDSKEKMVFIILKSFAGAKNECYPSLSTIADIANLCKRTIQNVIKSLESKQIIKVEHRKGEKGDNTSNLYILYDYPEIWEANTNEERKKIKEDIQEKQYIDMLESKGYKITKENGKKEKSEDMSDEELINLLKTKGYKIIKEDDKKEKSEDISDKEFINLLKTKGYKIISENDEGIENIPNENFLNTLETVENTLNEDNKQNETKKEITEETTESKITDINIKDNTQKGKNIFGNEKEPEKIVAPSESKTNSSSFKNIYINNFTPNLDKCQVGETYKLDEIRQIFNYSGMLNEYPIYRKEIDTALNVIYDVVNTKKPTIRIGSEDKPRDVVISKFMKLTGKYIIYAMSKFKFNETKIKHQISYMRTILYNAAEQYELEEQNNEALERNSTKDIWYSPPDYN